MPMTRGKGVATATTALALFAPALPLEASAAPAVSVLAQAQTHHKAAKTLHTRVRATRAAHWQGSQLKAGRISTSGFEDWGLTIDSAFAIAADGTQPRRLDRVTTAIARNYYSSYAVFQGDISAGAMAKSLLAARVLGRHPRHFGGHNVRRLVLRLVAPRSAGFESGRVRDTGKTDYSNTFSQSYAVLGLARTGGVPRRVVTYLLKQQCAKGYFRTFETAGKSCDRSSSGSDADATSLAIQALVAARHSGSHLGRTAIHRASRWLIARQHRNGGWGGGSVTRAVNANSTGLAVQALAAVHHRRGRAHAARYVASVQITRARAGRGPARRDIGAVAYNSAALRTALRHGITSSTRDQFRRSTAEAIYAFVPKPLSGLRVR
jgi:hypothetical protein